MTAFADTRRGDNKMKQMTLEEVSKAAASGAFLGYDPSLELTCVNGNLTITADAAEMKKVEDIP